MITTSKRIKVRKDSILEILRFSCIGNFKTSYSHNKSVLMMRIDGLSISKAELVKVWIERLPWVNSCSILTSKKMKA